MDVSPSPSPRGAAVRAIKPMRQRKSPDTTMDTAEARKFSKVNYKFDLNKLGINSSGGRDQFAKANKSDLQIRTPPERAISPVSSTDNGPEDFTINMMKYFEGVKIGDHIIPPWDESKDKRGKQEPNTKENSKPDMIEQPKPKRLAAALQTKTQSEMNELANPETAVVASSDHPSEGTIPSPTEAKASASHSVESSRRTSTQPSFRPDDSFYINDDSFIPQDVDSATYEFQPNYRQPSVEDYVSDNASLLSNQSAIEQSPHLPQGSRSNRGAENSLQSDDKRSTQSSSPMPWDQPLPEMHPTTQQVLDQICGLQEQVRAFQEEAEEERERSRALEEENNALTDEKARIGEEFKSSKISFTSEKVQLELELQSEKAANAAQKAKLEQDLQIERDASAAKKAKLEQELQNLKTANAAERAQLEQDLNATKAAYATEKAQLQEDIGAVKTTYATEKAQLINDLEEMKSEHGKEKAQLEWELEVLRNAHASEKAQLSQDLEAMKTQISTLTIDFENSKATITNLTTQLGKSEHDVNDLESEVDTMRSEKQALYDEMGVVVEELNASKAKVHNLTTEVHELKLVATEKVPSDNGSLQRELKVTKAELASATSKQRIAQQALLSVDAEKKDVESQLQELNVEITNVRYTLTKTRSALERTKNALQAKNVAGGRDLQDLEKKLKAAWRERESELVKERELMVKALFHEWGRQEVGDQAVEVEYPDGTKKRGKGYRYKY